MSRFLRLSLCPPSLLSLLCFLFFSPPLSPEPVGSCAQFVLASGGGGNTPITTVEGQTRMDALTHAHTTHSTVNSPFLSRPLLHLLVTIFSLPLPSTPPSTSLKTPSLSTPHRVLYTPNTHHPSFSFSTTIPRVGKLRLRTRMRLFLGVGAAFESTEEIHML